MATVRLPYRQKLNIWYPSGLPMFAYDSQTTLGFPRQSEGVSTPETRALPSVGLFAGIGGIELGLGSAGHPCRLACEVDASAGAVLRARFPDIDVHDDVRSLRELPPETRLLAGGFPCQDLSQAGRTAGIGGARSGLIGEVLRLAETHQVPYLLLENVPFMLQLSKGRALDVIVTALERLGYHWAYRVVDSRAFGLPQRRRRVLFVAARDEDPRRVLFADDAGPLEKEERRDGTACGFYWTEGLRGLGWAVDAIPTLKGGSSVGVPSPPAIWMPDGRIVTPDLRDAERLQGFESGWTAPAETVGRKSFRWKLVGNAVSVPVAKWVGDRLANPGSFTPDVTTHVVQKGKAWPTNAWNVGRGRYTMPTISEYPVLTPRSHLAEFLQYPPKDLSLRATEGFLSRTERAKLRFPNGFLAAVQRHCRRMKARASK